VLDQQGHTARALWNLLHEWYTWRGAGGSIAQRPSWAKIDRQLREARTSPVPGYEWLAALPAQATQQVVKHYLRAWDRFYQGLARPPRFKRRSSRLTVDNPQANQLNIVRLSRRWGEVTVLMVGRVRFRWTQPLPGVTRRCPGRITGARLVKDAVGWHICFRIEEPIGEMAPNSGPPIGMDRGVARTMTLSDGRHLDMPDLLTPGEQRRLRKLELQAARRRTHRQRTPGMRLSNRERDTYQQIAKLRARQARRRHDWLHKQTTDLAKNHGLVVVEDLRIQNMTRSARGTIEKPGKNVKAKTGLNRSILGMAWGVTGRMLAYKCPENGGVLIKVNPRNSSIECAACGHIDPRNRVGQSRFRCRRCGHQANADVNAARVLLARGLGLAAQAAPPQGMGSLDVESSPLGRP
jgi:putative transposase